MKKKQSAPEGRFDTPRMKKVIHLATRLQNRHEETLTEAQIEQIGRELGLDSAFIHQAVGEIEKGNKDIPSVRGAVKTTLQKDDHYHFALTFVAPVLLGAAAFILKQIGGLSIATQFLTYFVAPLLIGLQGYLSKNREIAKLGSRITVLSFALAIFHPALIIAWFLAPKIANWAADLREHFSPATLDTTEGISRQALLDSLFELQQKLDAQKERRAFLSVDIVESSSMVRNGQELEVEYSFGKFQSWADTVVRSCGGELQSVAGDGIMAHFSDDMAAVKAACRLQQEIANFNREQNRLAQPFRIRCGVSAGEIAVDPGTPIREVQSPAIYRAASLQKQASPGEVVVGEELSTDARLEWMRWKTVDHLPSGGGTGETAQGGSTLAERPAVEVRHPGHPSMENQRD